ncbi:MAG: hypothetical protein ABS921_11150 [Psychrobacter alimentarius]
MIVSDCSVDSDTVKCADMVLPAQGWGETYSLLASSRQDWWP